MCRKKTYATRLDALLKLVRLHSKGTPRTETRAYLCSDCGKYHLTSQRG